MSNFSINNPFTNLKNEVVSSPEIIQYDDAISEGVTINLLPGSSRVVYHRLLSVIDATVALSFNVTADTSNAKIGDKLVLLFKRSHAMAPNEDDQTINLSSNSNLVLLRCGDNDGYIKLNYDANNTNWLIIFTFDGEKFLACQDTC